MCDEEFDLMDAETILLPEPVFVPIRLISQYGIIDTRSYTIHSVVDSSAKAEFLAQLFNRYLATLNLKVEMARNLGH